jgi:hypothetical protein
VDLVGVVHSRGAPRGAGGCSHFRPWG